MGLGYRVRDRSAWPGVAKAPEPVPRPLRIADCALRLGSREAEKGWRDLCATQRNSLMTAWERLTVCPGDETPTQHVLCGGLKTIFVAGSPHDR